MTQQHQGQVLIRDVIRKSGRTQVSWAQDLNVSAVHLNNVIHGRKPYSISFAVRFQELCDVQAELLMHLQADHLVSLARLTNNLEAPRENGSGHH